LLSLEAGLLAHHQTTLIHECSLIFTNVDNYSYTFVKISED
jgi:hypothetical protein